MLKLLKKTESTIFLRKKSEIIDVVQIFEMFQFLSRIFLISQIVDVKVDVVHIFDRSQIQKSV